MTQNPPPGYPYPPPGYPYPQIGPVAPNGAPLADFWQRFLAWFIDRMIIGGAVLVLATPAFIWLFMAVNDLMDEQSARGPDARVNLGPILGRELAVIGIVYVIVLVVTYIYHVPLVKNGQTVGKRAMKIRVVRLADGQPPTRKDLTKRWAIQDLAALVPFMTYLDGLWQLWDKPYQQCLHDKVATTTVVRVA